VLPRDSPSLLAKRLPAADCVNDEPSIAAWGAKLGYPNGTCAMAVKLLGCEYNVASFAAAGGANKSVLLQDYCPRSCPSACTPASVLSRPFMDFVQNVTLAVSALTHRFARERNMDRAFDIVESITALDGEYVSFGQANQYLASAAGNSNVSCRSPFCNVAQRYAERFQALSNFNRKTALLNVLAPFSTFTSDGNDWVSAVYEALELNSISATTNGPIVINSLSQDYEVFFGGILNDMAASVDDLFASSPSRLFAIVVSTVMLASFVGFRSVLIGPRLLVTVFFTLSFTLGLSVFIFQDITSDGGVHWVVLLVSVPIMLGLTLDYDIFLLSQCYELRLMGHSTDVAVAMALQDTGPVITTAGVIMILAFGSLCLTGIPCLYQTGSVLLICCSVDTFVVRTLLVPAMMLVLVDYNWWPGKVPPPNSVTGCRFS